MEHRAFGKYEVLARLATGGSANIFLARQPGAAGFHKPVVLKTLLAERAADRDFVAMFLDEARLAARLVHPSCVQIYDLGRVRGVYYISMEFIFGETLWNLLTTVRASKVPLPPAHVAAIVADACDGLHHAHELKDAEGRPFHLVHRDVSPQNIMVSFAGQTKVVDFGIAKAETGRDPTHAGVVKGKFSYMSPEQITGSELDRRSDIFSLGIVLFECLASRRLFRGESPSEIAKLITERRVPRLAEVVPGIPEALDEICRRALQPRLGRRFQTALEMGDALRNHLEDVRHHQSSSALAQLLEERFGPLIPRRRQALERAFEVNETGPLLEAFGAAPVREVDLFPEEVDARRVPDFTESPTLMPGDGSLSGEPPAISDARAPAFRVELEAAEMERDRIVLGDPADLEPDDDGQTRRLFSPAVDPARVLASGSRLPADRTAMDGARLERVPGGLGEARGLEPVPGGLGEAPGVEPVPGGLGDDPGPELRASLDGLPEAPASEPSTARRPQRGAGLSTGVEPRPLQPTPPVVVAPLRGEAEGPRFGLAALLAALGFGLAFGVILGLGLARALFLSG